MQMDKKLIMAKAAAIKLAVFDVDGVLTDGKLMLGESGNEYKTFHVHDGYGLIMLLETGCKIAVITARSSNIVAERMASLGIKYVFQGEQDKGARLLSLMATLSLVSDQVAYVGDDVIDLPAMIQVGLPIAVADARSEVQNNAVWTTESRGGEGAVREVCELIMRAQGQYDDLIQRYLVP